MRRTPLFVVLITFCIVACIAAAEVEKEAKKATDLVVTTQDELTDATFAAKVLQPDYYLVKFYSPTCGTSYSNAVRSIPNLIDVVFHSCALGHCRALAKPWLSVVDALRVRRNKPLLTQFAGLTSSRPFA